MFINTLSSTVLFPRAKSRRPPRSSSSPSSSAFSSQPCTQSDTEAEEEKRFMNRCDQRRQQQQLTSMTPNVAGNRRRRDFVLPPLPFASCSTPKSSAEEFLLDETSIYFRPQKTPSRHHRGPRMERAAGEASSRKQHHLKAFHLQQRAAEEFYRRQSRGAVETRPPQGRNAPQIVRRRHVDKTARRRFSSNPLVAVLFDDDDGVDGDGAGRCSSPILLDFSRMTPESEQKSQQQSREDEHQQEEADKENQNPAANAIVLPQNNGPQANYAVVNKVRTKRQPSYKQSLLHQPYGNLSSFLLIHPKAPSFHHQQGSPPSLVNSFQEKKSSNSVDSGMGERCTAEEADAGTGTDCWEQQTQFENISGMEKIYENLPPAALEPPQPPSRLPPPHPPRPSFGGVDGAANFYHHQPAVSDNNALPPVEDFPALYGRLVALAFADARSRVSSGGGDTYSKGSSPTSTSAAARRIRLAQQQLAELVGLRVARGLELNAGTLDNEAEFRRRSADFGAQLAQRLRRTEALSRKEFNWQVKKVQKILHELRTAAEENNTEWKTGTLQKLLKRVFGRK